MWYKFSNNITQKEAFDKFMPIIESNGKEYNKKGNIRARKATREEKIDTFTSDGKETTNTAKVGDFIVENATQAKEVYVLNSKKFKSKYIFVRSGSDNWNTYSPTGKCMAVKYEEESIEFMASWDEVMVLKKGDFICTSLPEKNEVYRIAAKEFLETYE